MQRTKEQNSKHQIRNTNNGITLLALIITIVLMLILATITVNVVIDGGLFGYAKKAKDSTEIANEKETVQKANILAESTSKTGRVTEEEMQRAINSITEENAAMAMDNGETIIVKFNESNRYYEVDNKGKVEGPKELLKDDYAGDITKGGVCDGSEGNPFQITCIEDLVAFSIMTNGGNSELGLASSSFTDQYVILTRTLDFKSIFSYNEYTTTIYGDLNTDGTVEDIRTELTKTEEGCIGFAGINHFLGTFDGQENELKNIYQNVSTSEIALFIGYKVNVIKNISLSGNIVNSGGNAAGISANSSQLIINCKNYATVTGSRSVGGIVGHDTHGTNIIDCINFGEIKCSSEGNWKYVAGGVLGRAYGKSYVENCVNFGTVAGGNHSGGIVGLADAQINIINCANNGKTQGGISGKVLIGANIINCCNYGDVTSGIVNYFGANSWGENIELNIKNCYNLGKVTNGILGTQGTMSATTIVNIENCYNAETCDNAIIGTIIYRTDKMVITTNVTNTYYDQTKATSVGAVTEGIEALNEADMKNNETFVETLNNNIGENTNWKHWKIGEDGYPTFE